MKLEACLSTVLIVVLISLANLLMRALFLVTCTLAASRFFLDVASKAMICSFKSNSPISLPFDFNSAMILFASLFIVNRLMSFGSPLKLDITNVVNFLINSFLLYSSPSSFSVSLENLIVLPLLLAFSLNWSK